MTLLAAAIVIPPSTARLLTRSFGPLLVVSTVLGAIYGLAGMFISYATDIASGAAIVLLATAGFALAFGVTRLRRALLGRVSGEVHAPVVIPAGTGGMIAEADGHRFD